MKKPKPTPRSIDPDFAASLADGLTESYDAYCQRLDANTSNEPADAQPTDEAAT